ncbi:MAG: DUF4160 domain-containing protein [Tunicatimonas sp.]
MPEVSRFYGIIIYMYAKDHSPPHFHAKYAEHWAVIEIKTGDVMEGGLPRRALRLVQDWAELHKEELTENWNNGQSESPNFIKIEPLN